MSLLEIKNLHTYYGNIHALKGIDLVVEEHEIVALIGSNGAGKTTTLSSITGLVPAASGSILFQGKEISKMSSDRIVREGISMSPEGREVFPGLTVEENLSLGAYICKDKAEVQRNYDEVYELFPRLAERKKQTAGTLSGGEQQMLAIGRALMNKPKLILLDEPSLGLAPNLVDLIFDLIEDINSRGVTVLLIEQNANMALQIADRGYVIETGKIALFDTAENLADNPEVQRAYLGA